MIFDLFRLYSLIVEISYKTEEEKKSSLNVTIGKKDMKGVMRSHKSKKDQLYNHQKNRTKGQTKIHKKKSKNRATHTPQKTPEYTQVLQKGQQFLPH